jgi:hypothetical protein
MKKKNMDIELLSAYIDGELSPAEKKYIEEKIKSSLELQKELSDLKKLKELTTTSSERISESPFFETRFFANLNSEPRSKFNVKKWLPISALTLVTLGLMAVLKFNPNLIENIIKEQESNIVGFYKENLQPLLYAADLTNEDIFNFAVYQELPLDDQNTQILKLGSDVKGSEFFEIKKTDKVEQPDNLKKFAAALELDEAETRMMDSIINSYSDEISGLVLVNDQNSVAINPNIWNTRKLILADILAFAEKHASRNYNKMIPNQVVQFDDRSVAKWVNEAKAVKDNQYIFCTSDSIFKEDFEFDIAEYNKNMEKMAEDLAELSKQKIVLREYQFKIDTSFNRKKKRSDRNNQFEIFVDTNVIKVSVKNIALNIPEINLPDFDSIALVIHEATQHIRTVHPPSPPMTVGNKGYNYEYNKNATRKKGRSDINLDSLMYENNLQNEKNRIKQKEMIKSESDENGIKFFYGDSLIFMQNQELKREMDKLRKEIQKFREEFKEPRKQNDDTIKKDSSSDVEIFEI